MEAHRCILLLSSFIAMAAAAKLMGGLTEDRDGDEHAQRVANAIRPQIEAKLGANSITEFKVIKYKTQVVAGSNYYLKIQVAPSKYIHVQVFQSLKGENHLTGLDQNKSAADPIDFSIKALE